jgi:hypothetical protein
MSIRSGQCVCRCDRLTLHKMLGNLKQEAQKDWGLGGILSMDDIDGKAKGTLVWGGMPNLLWVNQVQISSGQG